MLRNTLAVVSWLWLCTVAACSSSSPPAATEVSRDEARSLLIDRNWIDRMPETPRDHLFVYRFVPSMGGGVFQDRTLFKGTFELFSFDTDGDQIHFVLHETAQDLRRPYKIERVDGPKPFDLKLTITDDPRGPSVYYGIRAETDRTGEKLQQLLK